MKYSLEDIRGQSEQLHSWTYVFFMQYPTIIITWIFANFTNLTPNAISVLGMIPNILSGYYFATGHMIIGALLYLVAWIFDAVDGRLARAKKIGSSYGAFFDNYMGTIGFIVTVVGMFYGLSQRYNSELWLILGIIVYFSVTFRSQMALKVKSLLGDSYKTKISTNKKVDPDAKTNSFMGMIVDHCTKRGMVEPFNLIDVIVLIFIVGPIVDSFFPGILLYLILFLLFITFIKEVLWFRIYKKALTE